MNIPVANVLTRFRSTNSAREVIAELLQHAGITINGDQPWDIQVHNEKVFTRFLAEGTLGLGESYMDGWWDCEALDEFICRALKGRLESQISRWQMLLPYLTSRLINLQAPTRAFQIGEAHYDMGNDLFEAMLDKRMVYSCGYWREAEDLDTAQEKKLDLICRKLQLEPGMRLLDIGCGWGALARYAAENYGVSVVGITVSKEQVALAREACAGLPIEIRLQDYRDLNEKFDRVVSVGMFEHVGYKNYRRFMEVVRRCLRSPESLFLLHTIGGRKTSYSIDPWISKYIFPNGQLPSAEQIAQSVDGDMVIEDWHNFGPDYDRTLMAWHRNFEASWPKFREKYGERFYRMWRYYLLICAGTFRARYNHLWQVVLSGSGVPGGYLSVR